MIFRLQLVHKKDIHSWSINVQTDLATGITAFLYYSPSPPRSLVIHIGNEVSCCVPSPIPQNPHHQQHYLGLVRFILRVKTHHIMYLPSDVLVVLVVLVVCFVFDTQSGQVARLSSVCHSYWPLFACGIKQGKMGDGINLRSENYGSQ